MLVTELKSKFAAVPPVREFFEELLVHAGYLVAYADRYDRRFVLADLRLIEISPRFPRLIRANVPAAVQGVRYIVNLDIVEGAAVPMRAALEKLGVV
jgi:hypothetical protein